MSRRVDTVFGRRIPSARLTWRAPALLALWVGVPVWAVLTGAELIWRALG